MRVDRGPDDPVDAVGRRRFDPKLAAPGLEEGGEGIGIGARRGHPIAQPGLERLGVGDGCFPEPEQGTDLGAVTFPGPTGRRISAIEAGLYVELLRHVLHGCGIDLRQPPWKPAMNPMEQQQQGEDEPVRPAFLQDKGVIRRRQAPGIRARAVVGTHFLKSPEPPALQKSRFPHKT
jgi:hypothetical protein